MSVKRRGNHEGTIKQRTDGRWEAQVSLPSGKRRSLYGKTRKEAQDKLRAALRSLDAGLDLLDERRTVAQLLETWLEDVVRENLRPKTYRSYEQIVRLHLLPTLGRHRLARLTPQHVQSMLAEKTRAGLSSRTVQYIRAVLRQALARALKWGWVSRNVAALADPPKVERTPVQPLTVEQAASFLRATRDHPLGPLFAVAVATGLRQGELFGLRWEDVDLDEGVLRVRHAMQRIDGTPRFVPPKSERSRRTIALPAVAVGALESQRERQDEQRLAAGERWQEWGLVFTSSVGTPLEPSNVSGRLHRQLAAAGLPRQRFHDLRHCFATAMLTEGIGARSVMEMLGHSQISLTLNTYAHVMPETLRDAAATLDAAFERQGGTGHGPSA